MNVTGVATRGMSQQMSQMGQSRRFDCVSPTSALPPSTNIVRSARQVRCVPRTDIFLVSDCRYPCNDHELAARAVIAQALVGRYAATFKVGGAMGTHSSAIQT